jgi:hypothetical protein
MATQRVEPGGELRRAHRSSSFQQRQASMERHPLRLRCTIHQAIACYERVLVTAGNLNEVIQSAVRIFLDEQY